MRGVSTVTVSTLAIATLLFAAQARAQNTPEDRPTEAAPAAGEADAVGDIIVTANKRSENARTVGMAITAASSEQLIKQGVVDVPSLGKIEPSLVVSEGKYGAPNYTIRGIGYNDYAIAASPTVSVYVDQIPYAYLATSKNASLDVERVEILKGPQGTLFGQNATGGAVNFIAAKPTSELKFGADMTMGMYGSAMASAFISAPLTDTLGIRVAADTTQGGGWQKSNTYGDMLGDRDLTRGRVLLSFEPTDRLTVNLNVNGLRDKSDTRAAQAVGYTPQRVGPYPNTPIADPALRGRTFPAILGLGPVAPPTDNEQADWYHGVNPRLDQRYWQVTGRVDYKLADFATLSYLGAYEDYEQDDVTTPSGRIQASYFRQNATVHANNHELRVGGSVGPVDYVLGGTYAFSHVDENDILYYRGITTAYSTITLPVLTGLRSTYVDPTTGSNPTADTRMKTTAAFGNVDVHIGDTIKLHAGGRYTDARIRYAGCSRSFDANAALGFTALQIIGKVPNPVTVAIGQCQTLDASGRPAQFRDELNENNFSWRVGADWTPLPGTLLYATVSKGYKAGSFPVPAATSYVQLLPVTQESVLAYEIGTKTRFLDNKVDIEAALFYYDYRDKQLTSNRPDPLGIFGIVNALVNVPKSAEKGAELTMRLRPVTGLTLVGQATYIDSYVKDHFSGFEQFSAVPVDLDGEPFPNTPKWSLSGNADYDFPLTNSVRASIGVSARYQSEAQGAFGSKAAIARGFPSLLIEPYTVVDLRAGIEAPDRRWSAQVFANNVLDNYYYTQSLRIFDGTVRYAGPPRIVGLRLGYRY